MLSTRIFTALNRTLAVLACTFCGHSFAMELSKAPANAKVYIVQPKNGAVVTSPVTIKFGIKNMMVMQAGVQHPNSGHHHLLVDLAELPDLTNPIPADENHIHFGKGQTETTLELPPGEHTLQLLLGDHYHRPHDKPVVSEKITITVAAPIKAAPPVETK